MRRAEENFPLIFIGDELRETQYFVHAHADVCLVRTVPLTFFVVNS